MLGPTPTELRNITTKYKRLEDKLEAAEDRVLRLRKQKRIQYNKIIYIVSYRLNIIKELDYVKAEERIGKEYKAIEVKVTCSAITVIVDSVKGINQFTINLGSFINIGFVIKNSSMLLSTPGSSF